MKQQNKGYRTVLAGFILMLFSGSSFIMGNFAPFVQSYFSEATIQKTQILHPLATVWVAIGNFVGANVVKMEVIRPKKQIMLGALITVCGVLVSSEMTDLMTF